MRRLHRVVVSLLGAFSLACPVDVATPADTDATGTGTGTGTDGASNSDTGANSSLTATGTPTTGEPGESTEPGPGSTANLDSGDTASSGDNSSSGTGSSSSTGESSSSTGDALACGDGQPDPGEACDDANDIENDGCLATCEFGPGAVIEQKPLPPLAMLENLRCFTAIDQEQLPGDEHALVFGSIVGHAGPEGQDATRVELLRLPEIAQTEWSYFEWAGVYGRVVNRMVTAANGDVIVAGMIYTEAVNVDSGGYLWLARFTPGGQVVWSEEYEEHELSPVDIELAPDGDIVLVGSFTGFGYYTAALRFRGDGQLVWEREEPLQADLSTVYSGLTLDDEGNIYLAASRRSYGNKETSVMLQALTGDGQLLWTKLYAPPDAVSVYPGEPVWTPDDRLVVGVNRRDVDTYQLLDQFSLVAFDTAGVELWWETWGTEAASGLAVGRLIANNDGGVHALVRQISAGDNKVIASLATRFDATGALVWSQLTPGADSRDALHGPDGLLYVLSRDAVLVHLP